MDNENLVFSGRILDNVHGFIYYTKAEEKIINTELFKRLQSIKQLSIVNWVFPGSEHTRYIHSLGVMYIADKIAVQLKLSKEKRKLIRLAGLLHDIGHYPLSHVCEMPYKENISNFPDDDYCKKINGKVKQDIDLFEGKLNWNFMKNSIGMHHERIGAEIILHNKEIYNIIVDECGEDAPQAIADIICGNVERAQTDSLLVQILHSELDADGIDYLMRDAVFSGTSFGAFELDQLIGCMEIGIYEGEQILCINPKGIAAADQYLINKFFSYSQVVYNKHISITEWMAEQIVNWMQKNNAYFPKSSTLKEWVCKDETSKDFIDFTDNYFWASLQNILKNPLVDTVPNFIKLFCEKLLHHNELEYVDKSEIKIVSNDMEQIKEFIQGKDFYKRLEHWDNNIGICSKRSMTKQIPQKEFDKVIDEIIEEGNKNPEDPSIISEEDKKMLNKRRYMECICVKDEDEIKLLCDDERSIMRINYNLNLVIFRTYKFTS